MVIRVESVVAATLEACFDSHLDIGLHRASATASFEKVVSPRQEGRLALGEEVTFEGKHLGIRFRMTSKVVAYERPLRFVDEMQKGPFRWLRHVHTFEAVSEGTRVVDEMDFASGFGRLADALIARHLRRFLEERSSFLKRYLETGHV